MINFGKTSRLSYCIPKSVLWVPTETHFNYKEDTEPLIEKLSVASGVRRFSTVTE